MSELFGSGLIAQPERPVYLCTRSTELGAAIALDLRHYGFKARTFVSLDVASNAAGSATPGSFIVDTSLLDIDPDGWDRLPALRAMAPLLILSERDDFRTRRDAARAGAAAFVTRPVSLMTLMYELRRCQESGGERDRRVTMLTTPGSTLAGYQPALAQRGWRCAARAPEDILEIAADRPPQLFLLDADWPDDAGALLRMIRQIHALSVIPVLLCTSGDKRALDAMVAGEGADGTIGLPVEVDDLEAILDGRIRRAASLWEAFRFIGSRDPLTGLQTAGQFIENLSHSVATGAFEHSHAGVMVVELAEAVTGGSGHLVRAAQVLRRKLPPFATAARLNDRLLAAAFSAASERELEAVARSLREGLEALGEEPPPAVGLAVLDGSVDSVETALESARRAYPSARSPASPAADTGHARGGAELGEYWERRVRQALQRNRFRLVYQPISSLNGQPSALFEVFVRLLDEDDSDILPQEFLPAVQRSGLSAELDRWIIGRAIHVLAEHAGRMDQPRLFVKVFPESLADRELAGWVMDQARTAGLPPDRLVMEIPQRAAATRAAQARPFCHTLRQAGFPVAIENFTPEADSLALLRELRPAYVKLAASVTGGAHLDRQAQSQISEVTTEARALGIATVAAQVQDAVVLSALWQAGVEYIQGYFMQEPADVFFGQQA